MDGIFEFLSVSVWNYVKVKGGLCLLSSKKSWLDCDAPFS